MAEATPGRPRQRDGHRPTGNTFWDIDLVFYGHVLGFKGLERSAVVVNEEGKSSARGSGSTSDYPAPVGNSSSLGIPTRSARSVARISPTEHRLTNQSAAPWPGLPPSVRRRGI